VVSDTSGIQPLPPKKYSRNLGKKEGIELVALSADSGKAARGTSE
jgi:hypothetical protein